MSRRYGGSDREIGAAARTHPTRHGAQVELTRKEREQLEAQEPEEPDPETIAKDMDRLAIIKKRREDQAAARIEKDGYDRMLPQSETNHPPNTIWPPVGGGS